MQEQMKNMSHWDLANEKYYVNFEINSSENRIILNLENGYQIDFNIKNSMHNVFGFIRNKNTQEQHKLQIMQIYLHHYQCL